jgi:hypothetical protein
MAIVNDELNEWFEQLGPDAWAKAYEECRRRGRDGTPQEVLMLMLATKGTNRIRAVWLWLQTASGEELLASKGAAPAELGC